MKKRVLFLLLILSPLMAQEHYAKVNPIETYTIKAAVSGQVVYADDSKEGLIDDHIPIVKIDDKVDKAQLKALLESLDSLKKTLLITKDMQTNQALVFKRDNSYYKRIKNLSTKSKTEKDRVFSSMIASNNQLLSLKEKIQTLQKQIADTNYQIFMLKDRISKKTIVPQGLYIYKVAVRKGDYVNPGSLLLTAMDTHKARLTIYLDPQEVSGIEHKIIFINGKPTKLKLHKLIRVADSVHISAYRADIILKNPGSLFSKLVKVEIK